MHGHAQRGRGHHTPRRARDAAAMMTARRLLVIVPTLETAPQMCVYSVSVPPAGRPHFGRFFQRHRTVLSSGHTDGWETTTWQVWSDEH